MPVDVGADPVSGESTESPSDGTYLKRSDAWERHLAAIHLLIAAGRRSHGSLPQEPLPRKLRKSLKSVPLESPSFGQICFMLGGFEWFITIISANFRYKCCSYFENMGN